MDRYEQITQRYAEFKRSVGSRHSVNMTVKKVCRRKTACCDHKSTFTRSSDFITKSRNIRGSADDLETKCLPLLTDQKLAVHTICI